jgi:hypothetical protein
MARTLPIRFFSQRKRAGGIYDAQDVGLYDDCRPCLRIRCDDLRDDAYCRSDRSLLLPKSRDVEALEAHSAGLGNYEFQVLAVTLNS